MEKRICDFIFQYRWALFFASIVLAVVSSIGITKFAFDADPQRFFNTNNEHFQLNKSLEERYGRIHQVTVGIEFKDTIYTAQHLKIIEEYTQESWQLPYIKRVDSLANYAYSWSEGDELYVEELVENAESFTEDQVKRIKHIATTDDAIKQRLVSLSAPIALVRSNAAFPYKNRVAEEQELADAAKALVEKFEAKYPEIDILISGNVISNTETNMQAIEDSSKLIPLMYLIIFGLLGILLRSFFAVLGIAFITVLSCLSALGFAAHIGMVMNLLSITCLNIIITVSIAHCVHLYVHFLQDYRHGKNKLDALKESFRINIQPIFLTSFTTALGFLSMNFSDTPPAHDLGNITAFGVMIAFTLSLSFLPVFMLISPIKQKPTKGSGQYLQNMDKFSNFIVNHRNKVGIASLLISLGFVAMAPLNIINDKFTENLKKPHPFRYDNEKIDQHFGGLYTIEYDFKAKEGQTISSPEYLKELDTFTQWLRQQESISNVHTYTDIIKRLNMNMHGGDPEHYRIPDSGDEAAQYLLLYELSQPFGSDMGDLVQPDKSATRLIVNIPSFDSIKVIELRNKLKDWVEQNMPEYLHYPGEGLAVAWMYLGADIQISNLEGALFALCLISIILTFVFKSLRYGFISLIPNLLPAGIGYGVWYLISGSLDMSQMMVMCITIGIVVDDTVHFLSKYIRGKKEHHFSNEDAVRYAFRNVGAPLWITTLVLVAGFALLITSSFQPNSNLGMLTALILVAALALDFFLLPSLLMWLDKDKEPVSESYQPE